MSGPGARRSGLCRAAALLRLCRAPALFVSLAVCIRPQRSLCGGRGAGPQLRLPLVREFQLQPPAHIRAPPIRPAGPARIRMPPIRLRGPPAQIRMPHIQPGAFPFSKRTPNLTVCRNPKPTCLEENLGSGDGVLFAKSLLIRGTERPDPRGPDYLALTDVFSTESGILAHTRQCASTKGLMVSI